MCVSAHLHPALGSIGQADSTLQGTTVPSRVYKVRVRRVCKVQDTVAQQYYTNKQSIQNIVYTVQSNNITDYIRY